VADAEPVIAEAKIDGKPLNARHPFGSYIDSSKLDSVLVAVVRPVLVATVVDS
jgi:hypothetical protein